MNHERARAAGMSKSEGRVCGFCRAPASDDRDGGGNLLGPLPGDKPLWTHEMCALFSPATRLREGEPDGEGLAVIPDDIPPSRTGALTLACLDAPSVRKEVARGAKLPCEICRRPGASIGCFVCSRRCFHYPCAQRAGLVEWHWWESGHHARVVHCPEHLDARGELYWSGDDPAWPSTARGWYRIVIVDGPVEGEYLNFYCDEPFGQEMVDFNLAPCRLDPPPSDECARWKAVRALVSASTPGGVPSATADAAAAPAAVALVSAPVNAPPSAPPPPPPCPLPLLGSAARQAAATAALGAVLVPLTARAAPGCVAPSVGTFESHDGGSHSPLIALPSSVQARAR